MRHVEGLDPLGFPHCARFPYYLGGSASICATCAARSLEPVPDAHCQVCSQALGTARRCSNALCELPPGERGFSRVDAIAMFSATWRTRSGASSTTGPGAGPPSSGAWSSGGWSATPGRMADVDLIVGNPTWTGRTPIQHIETILKAAAVEDAAGRWPFPTSPVLVKPVDTERSAGKNREAKRLAAAAHARPPASSAAYRTAPSSSSTTCSPPASRCRPSPACCVRRAPPRYGDSSSPERPGAARTARAHSSTRERGGRRAGRRPGARSLRRCPASPSGPGTMPGPR